MSLFTVASEHAYSRGEHAIELAKRKKNENALESLSDVQQLRHGSPLYPHEFH